MTAATICVETPALESTWTQTATNTYNWNTLANWTNGFPKDAGDVANLNIDLAGNQTLRLQQDIALGVLNLGDASGNSTLSIQNPTGGTSKLTFDNGAAAAQINTSGSSNPSNSITVPITLNSDLAVRLGGADSLTFGSGATPAAITTNNHDITFSGGIASATGIFLNGDITGNGVITNSGNMAVSISGTKSFTGTLMANKGIGGSNTGSFTLTNGSLANAAEFIINGYLTNGITQNGGSIHAGSGTAFSDNPGQRLTTNTITLNGGSLRSVGQPAVVN
ncbi:MAG TPA: hypothetical protein VD994_05305, partial [Prosthecobacter sp.]|nr:hypothetical protein [Prosthecobacter sp.]